MQIEFALLSKIGAALVSFVLVSLIGGSLFFTVARRIVVKYFDSLERNANRGLEELQYFKNREFRDYKRDMALAVKELYDRTDNHEEVQAVVKYCRSKNLK
jgi:hypothetical protein